MITIVSLYVPAVFLEVTFCFKKVDLGQAKMVRDVLGRTLGGSAGALGEFKILSSNRAPKGLNKLSDFGICFYFLIVFIWFYGVLIIPKWLTKVPGHIAILFA